MSVDFYLRGTHVLSTTLLLSLCAVTISCVYKLICVLLCYLQGIGGVMMGVGLWAVTQKSDYSEFSSISTDPAAVMIAVGAFIFIISFFGTVGALRENICFLRTVSACISLQV